MIAFRLQPSFATIYDMLSRVGIFFCCWRWNAHVRHV